MVERVQREHGLKIKRNFHLKPAQVIVLGFATVIICGALLLMLPQASVDGHSLPFIDALFTATSAVCVTGLVVVDTGTYFTIFGQVVILMLIQIGGLGFMTLATLLAMLVGKRISLSNRIAIQESLGQNEISGVVRVTKYVFYLTVITETLGMLFLAFRFVPIYGERGWYLALFHAVSAFCNAGFDLFGGYRSLTPFVEDPFVLIPIMSLIIIGGLGFNVIFDILKTRNFRKLSLNSKVVLSITATLLLFGFLFIFVAEHNNPDTMGNLSLKGKILGSAFHSVTPRTAGFNALPTDKLYTPTIMLTIILMFIGGSPSSTAGGIKTTTFGLVLVSILGIIRGEEDTTLFHRRVAKETVMRAMAILGIAIAINLVMLMLLTIFEPHIDFLQLFFEEVSAFGTVGLSMGITPNLSPVSRLVLILTMFMGRVGVLTFVLAIARKQQSHKALLHYPESKIIL